MKEHALPRPLMTELVIAVLARDASFRFRAGGNSMYPMVRNGDVVSIVPLTGHRPGIGDIVAFLQEEGQPTVHRVVRFKEGGYVLKGDNYCFGQSDGAIPKTQFLGMVSKIERKGREVRFGLGLERYAIAFISRLGVLPALVQMIKVLYRTLKRIWKMLST